MARRRHFNRRHRRGRFGFLYKVVSVLAICGAIVLALTLFFRINTLEVTGQQRYTVQQIQQASGIRIGDNMFLINKFDAASALREKLPYIEEVRINRRLPATLTIQVRECTWTAAVQQNGSAWLIGPSGKIVERTEPDAEAAQTSAVLDGCELLSPSVGTMLAMASEKQTQQSSLLALLAALEDREELDLVSGIHLSEGNALTLDYAGRFTVMMPYGGDYPYLLRAARAVMDQLETNETGTIDLTTEGKAYFRQN